MKFLFFFQARVSLLVFVASFLTIMAIGGFPSFVEDMKVHNFLWHHYINLISKVLMAKRPTNMSP